MGAIMGDEHPFPIAKNATEALAAAGPGEWRLGVGVYSAYRIGPVIELIASGMIRLNMTAALHVAPLTVFPPQYGLFFFVPPLQMPAEMPFVAQASFQTREAVASLTVFDARGKHIVPVKQL